MSGCVAWKLHTERGELYGGYLDQSELHLICSAKIHIIDCDFFVIEYRTDPFEQTKESNVSLKALANILRRSVLLP